MFWDKYFHIGNNWNGRNDRQVRGQTWWWQLYTLIHSMKEGCLSKYVRYKYHDKDYNSIDVGLGLSASLTYLKRFWRSYEYDSFFMTVTQFALYFFSECFRIVRKFSIIVFLVLHALIYVATMYMCDIDR